MMLRRIKHFIGMHVYNVVGYDGTMSVHETKLPGNVNRSRKKKRKTKQEEEYASDLTLVCQCI